VLRRLGSIWLRGALASLFLIGAAFGEDLHFLIPAGPGGGLDGTARTAGRLLTDQGLVDKISFENMTGGGGGRAMSHFIETAPRQHGTLLVNSTPLVVRALQGLFPHSYRDLTPLAALIGDYGAFVVKANSPHASWNDVVQSLAERPRGVTFGGGSVRGSLDHIALAMAVEAVGIEPRAVRYLPYDGGGQAMLALLGGEVAVLSTGLGESLSFSDAGEVRILAITAPQRHPRVPDVPTFKELGFAVEIVNWRGFFGPPGLPDELVRSRLEVLSQLAGSEPWRTALARQGWVDLFVPNEAFEEMLAAQEARLGAVMSRLGFLN
jgi:putative tricarboxylic transport membrane protein